jgi:hypothetical protein
LAVCTTVDPAGAGVLDVAVDCAAGDGVASGVGAVFPLGVDVPPAEPRAFAEPCSSCEDRGDAVKAAMAAMATMATKSTDAEAINARRPRAVIQQLEFYGLRNRC